MNLPPHNLTAEQALIGCLLLSPKEQLWEFVADFKDGEKYFYDLRHAEIFKTVFDLANAGKPVDMITVQAELQRRGQCDTVEQLAYLHALPDATPSAANMTYYAVELRGLFQRRQLLHISHKLAQQAIDSTAEQAMEFASRALLDISTEQQEGDSLTMTQLARSTIDELEESAANKGTVRGIITGYPDFDRRTRGLKPGQMVVLAARPGCGKTSLALNVADYVAVNCNEPVGIFSLEMTSRELFKRMICTRSRVPMDLLENGGCDSEQCEQVTEALRQLTKAPIHIQDPSGISVHQLAARARRMKHRHGIKLLVVDYLQLLKGKRTENRTVEMTEVSNAIKCLAKELQLPVLVLSQLNRGFEKDGDRKPRLSDLRETGAIEQDADIVAFIYPTPKDSKQKTPATSDELIQAVTLGIAKHRSGACGELPLTFFKAITRFESATK